MFSLHFSTFLSILEILQQRNDVHDDDDEDYDFYYSHYMKKTSFSRREALSPPLFLLLLLFVFLSFFLSTSSESWKKYTAVYYPLLVRFLLDLGPSCLDKKNCYIHFFSFPSHLPSSNYGNGP